MIVRIIIRKENRVHGITIIKKDRHSSALGFVEIGTRRPVTPSQVSWIACADRPGTPVQALKYRERSARQILGWAQLRGALPFQFSAHQ